MNTLARDVTTALYSSLQIEESLHKTVLLLKAHFPLDLIHVFIMDRSKNTLRYLAEATARKGLLIDERLHLPDVYIQELQKQAGEDIRILNRSESPMLQSLHNHFLAHVKKPLFQPEENFSVITMGFDIGKPLIGGVGLVARGKDRFSDAHARRAEQIRRPMIGAVLNLLHHRDVAKKNEQLLNEKQALENKLGHGIATDMIGAETGLKQVTAMVAQVADIGSPVMLTGETGTGKEVVATAIHQSSRRSDGPMIRVNCGAIAESLMDSELFGHEKGAFTGATQLKRGYFEQADGGTIFLDEIGDLPLAAQVKLLRVLQTMEFHRVGGTWPVSVDIRVVAATNRDLSKMVKENLFREDLWFRLNVFPIKIPPLRDRKQDIPALAEYFVIRKSREMNLVGPPHLSDSALLSLKSYDWPGNIRELQNVIERGLILGRGHTLSFDGLIPGSRPSSQESLHHPPDVQPMTMDKMIRHHITQVLDITGGKIDGNGGAAAILDMHPSTLRSRMKKLGITINKSVRSGVQFPKKMMK